MSSSRLTKSFFNDPLGFIAKLYTSIYMSIYLYCVKYMYIEEERISGHRTSLLTIQQSVTKRHSLERKGKKRS